MSSDTSLLDCRAFHSSRLFWSCWNLSTVLLRVFSFFCFQALYFGLLQQGHSWCQTDLTGRQLGVSACRLVSLASAPDTLGNILQQPHVRKPFPAAFHTTPRGAPTPSLLECERKHHKMTQMSLKFTILGLALPRFFFLPTHRFHHWG